MSRPSRLGVVLRLARLEARDALAALGAAQRVLAGIADQRAELTAEQLAAGHACAPELGTRVAVDTLQDARRYAASLAVRRARLENDFEDAVEAERGCRERVAEKRARVRAVERAIERRRAREQQVERRRETRRIDEAQRGNEEAEHASA